jgi:hypothetical protein
MSHTYEVYGLGLSSNLPIPGLIELPATWKSDVRVSLGLIPHWLDDLSEAREWFISPYKDDRGEPAVKVWKLAGGTYFRLLYNDKTEFIVDRFGTKVWATWLNGLTLEDTATYLLGPILGFVLRLRGVTCLHASAIAVDDQAITLLGAAGAGKSTAAAAFAERGCPVLSDDIVALWDCDRAFLVQPGYPYLCLWPSSVGALYGGLDDLPRLAPTWDKRYLDLTQDAYRFQQQPVRLAAVYILGERCPDSTAPSIDAVPAKDGLMALVANTYATCLLDKAIRAREFEFLGRLATAVPLRRVRPHIDPARLSNLCELIVDDLQALSRSACSEVSIKHG